jgi:hypothetical protein
LNLRVSSAFDVGPGTFDVCFDFAISGLSEGWSHFAFDYSAADFEKWCREVGFKRFEVIHLAGPSRAAIAYK